MQFFVHRMHPLRLTKVNQLTRQVKAKNRHHRRNSRHPAGLAARWAEKIALVRQKRFVHVYALCKTNEAP
jgi:hypothetical protein